LRKFERFRPKIGHPPVFRDYSSVEIRADDLAGNVRRSVEFEIRRRLGRIGEKVDRNEWYMTPPTVNAYFSPPDNEIVFPAGILQPPFFDPEMDDAVNYGAIGAVISHEITHGYDDQGRRYDLQGNLNDWWTEEDRKNFLERADELGKLYSSLEIFPGFHVNGELTMGENIADLGGVSIAYDALQKHLEKNPHMRREIDGLSPEQRFFISWAQIWKSNQKEQHAKMLISMDSHSPNRFRATIPVYNHPDFEKVFKPDGSPGNNNGGRKKIGLW
ncbi:MAG: M13 family metallopeptidase, partial [Candidatus Thermoplasmatota archaeon]|nr:M13 family metallopeptidase [Candidatus Thermoplasmatota archaeon]